MRRAEIIPRRKQQSSNAAYPGEWTDSELDSTLENGRRYRHRRPRANIGNHGRYSPPYIPANTDNLQYYNRPHQSQRYEEQEHLEDEKRKAERRNRLQRLEEAARESADQEEVRRKLRQERLTELQKKIDEEEERERIKKEIRDEEARLAHNEQERRAKEAKLLEEWKLAQERRAAIAEREAAERRDRVIAEIEAEKARLLQQRIRDEEERERFKMEIKAEEARQMLERQKREQEVEAIRRAAVEQYKLEQKVLRLENEVRRLKFEQLEKEFRERFQAMLSPLLDQVNTLSPVQDPVLQGPAETPHIADANDGEPTTQRPSSESIFCRPDEGTAKTAADVRDDSGDQG